MKDIKLMREHIKEVIDEADEKTVEMVHQLLEDGEPDPLEDMTEEDMALLRKSLKQAAKGDVIPHATIKKEYEQWP